MKTDILKEIANDCGTPSYVFDIDELAGRIRRIREILGEDINVLYAMKANPFLVQTMTAWVDRISKIQIMNRRNYYVRYKI